MGTVLASLVQEKHPAVAVVSVLISISKVIVS